MTEITKTPEPDYLIANSGIYSEIIAINYYLESVEFFECEQLGENRIIWDKDNIPSIEFGLNNDGKQITQ